MAEDHPDVTVSPAQARQARWAFPYQQTPELTAKFMLFSEKILSITFALLELAPSVERGAALDALQEASRRIQEVYMLEEGTPLPPHWLHVEAPPEETP